MTTSRPAFSFGSAGLPPLVKPKGTLDIAKVEGLWKPTFQKPPSHGLADPCLVRISIPLFGMDVLDGIESPHLK